MTKQYLLLIDDDPDEFEFLLSALEKVPGLFECGYAVSGHAAFSLLEEIGSLPDCILVDMNMPLMNGLECIGKLRKMEQLSNVPVFIYSTGSDEILQKKAIQNGATGCIRKTFEMKMLAQMLERLHHTGKPY